MPTPVPTLSLRGGWVVSIAEKCDVLLAHFYEAQKSQTALYGDNVASLQYLIEEHGNNVPALCEQMRATLGRYFGRHFDNVSFNVTEATVADIPADRIQLNINGTVTEDGEDFSFGRLLLLHNSKFERVLAYNNEGVLLQ